MDTKLVRLHRGSLPALRQQLPAIVERAGRPAQTAWRDYFDGILPNDNTRRAYTTAVRQFCAWCEEQRLASG